MVVHPGIAAEEMNALRAGFTIEEIFNLTKIDGWFLVQIKEILNFEENSPRQMIDVPSQID